jgi:LacI family transcriptional regulator
VGSSEEDPECERELIESLLARGVDALVLASSQPSPNGVFQRIEAQKVPYVLVDRMVPGLKAHFVGVDNERIGVLATQHLVKRGYRRIAHIRGPGLSTAAGRFKGYQRVLMRHGIPLRPDYVVVASSTDERGEACGFSAMLQLLGVEPRPDAVFCYNDLLASGALKAILDSGLSVPSDVAVIGASNLSSLHFWSTTRFRLSTVDQSVGATGDQAARLILRLLESAHPPPRRRTILPAKLIVGDST